MVFAKAFAVGIVMGLLAPVVVVLAQVGTALVVGFGGGFAVTGGGGGRWPSHFLVSSNLLFTLIGVGFAIGFLFTLWRAFVRRQAQ